MKEAEKVPANEVGHQFDIYYKDINNGDRMKLESITSASLVEHDGNTLSQAVHSHQYRAFQGGAVGVLVQ